MKKITLINYDIGNLLSVKRALQYLDADVIEARTPQDILNADKLILPGVGAFATCVNEVKSRGFENPLREAVDKGKPLLGICVGMQMLFDKSEEFGKHDGLGFISGEIKAIPTTDMQGLTHKIPHIAWSALQPPIDNPQGWSCPLLKDIEPNSEVYYVHSYAAHTQDSSHRVADSFYGDHPIAALVQKNNIYGAQFHPEKSGPVGLKILENFIKL
jgi:glutamine amidotransferase